ncbi:putative polyprenol-phosphate-mannosyl transferase [Mycobacterium xenopi 4042]|uniref:Putative polyprenol-phosphate-mannosyl transferase n=1 Tax=Mycobacterium xenopi 4042 TaxID=1299334 RepID=X8BDM1_MYCXE|nr:putative polyprenol-phosphate-mannosyl transferase [Mycobacterium xenopi 4042]
MIFERALRESVHNGAQLLATPANNANFDQRMSEQQLAFSKIRAVELDRYAVVASNTGISAVIAPDGRELERTDFFVPAYLDTQVRLRTTLTPAPRWEPIVQWMLVLAGAAAVLVAIRHNGWFPRPMRGRWRPTGESPAPADASGSAPRTRTKPRRRRPTRSPVRPDKGAT